MNASNFVPHRNSLGFTLIELIVTISVASILLALAAPSFREFIASQRIRAASSDLVQALSLARSEAIKRNTGVTIVAKNSDWVNGWDVSTGGAVVRSQDGLRALTITSSPSLTTLTYASSGRLTSSSTSFTVNTNPAISNVTPRCVTIDLSGLPSSKSGSC